MDGLTLVTGGARSGKTAFALQLARAARGPVCYVATATAGDEEMTRRIARHREERPLDWLTREAPVDVPAALAGLPRCDLVVVDCLTLWVSNLLLARLGPTFPVVEGERAAEAALAQVHRLLTWQRQACVTTVVVSNEVGLGIVPADPLTRLYRDTLGRATRLVAAAADRVYLVVAGLALDLRAAGAVAVDDGDGARGEGRRS